MLRTEGMKRGNTNGFMALQSQPSWDSLAVCCLCPQSLLQLYVLKCCLGLTGYQQDWLNQLLEESPGSCQTQPFQCWNTSCVSAWNWLLGLGVWSLLVTPRAAVTGRWGGSMSLGVPPQLGTAEAHPTAGHYHRHLFAEGHVAMAPAYVNHPRVTT